MWALLVISFFAGSGGTWCARLLARKFGIVNYPNKIVPQHTRPVAYLGGPGIFVGFATASLFGYVTGFYVPSQQELLALWLPGGVFLLLGLVDDLRPLEPLPKFGLQLGAALLAAFCGNVFGVFDIYWLDFGLSCFVLLFVVNAFNFTDVCDGLVAGLTIIALVCAGFLHPEKQLLSLMMTGSCLGFLLLNKPPATIFLGDAGSHLLGFWCVHILLGPLQEWYVGVQNLLILSVPIFEAVFITAVRIDKGLPWWKGSPDHFSLRLQRMGFSKYQTNLSAWSVACTMGLIALVLPGLARAYQVFLLVLVCALFTVIWKWLLKVDGNQEDVSGRGQ